MCRFKVGADAADVQTQLAQFATTDVRHLPVESVLILLRNLRQYSYGEASAGSEMPAARARDEPVDHYLYL